MKYNFFLLYKLLDIENINKLVLFFLNVVNV